MFLTPLASASIDRQSEPMNSYLVIAVIALVGWFVLKGMAGAQTSPDQVRKAIGDGALVIDVRSATEYAEGHLEGALNIPHDRTQELIRTAGTDKSRSIVVYCRSGRRSAIALSSLQQSGYTNVLNGGGYERLRERR